MNLKKQKKTIKLIRCFNYSNIHEISGQIEKLTISYSKKETISLKVFIKIYTFLELITGQRAFFIRSKKSIAALKIRKGMPIGAKVTLRNFFLFSFLFKLVWQVLPNIKTYNIKKKKIGLKKNSLVITVPSALNFMELQPFYFFFKSFNDLKLVLSFASHISKTEFFFISRFYKLVY